MPVVVGQPSALNAFHRQPGDATPDLDGLFVTFQHRHPHRSRIEAQSPVVLTGGDELPGVTDRAFFEVVPKGKIAVHLEEGAVARGLADLLDVEGAHALLHRRGPWPGRGLLTGQIRDEGHHSRDREQERGIGADQRGAGDDGVAFAAKERKPTTADLSGFHDSSSSRLR